MSFIFWYFYAVAWENHEIGWILPDFRHLKKTSFCYIKIEPLHQSHSNFGFTKQKIFLTDEEKDNIMQNDLHC